MKNDVENNQIPKKKKKKGTGIIFLLVVVLMIAGVIYENSEERQFVDMRVMLEDLCDLGTYTCAYTLTENDNVQNEDLVFVFISGYGTPSSYTDFYSLRSCLSEYGDCISFDRSGFGYSTSTSIERSLSNLVYELEVLIDSKAPGKNIVLLAHGEGSLEAIGYAQKHKDIVKAIVFLDAGSPEYYAEVNEYKEKAEIASFASIRILGLNRILGNIGCIFPFYGERTRYKGLPDAYKEFDLESYYYEMGNFATWDIVDMLNENANEVIAGGNLSSIPILCISRDGGTKWENVQKELSLWSSESTSCTLENGKHYIHWSNEEETIESIQYFLADKEIISNID